MIALVQALLMAVGYARTFKAEIKKNSLVANVKSCHNIVGVSGMAVFVCTGGSGGGRNVALRYCQSDVGGLIECACV